MFIISKNVNSFIKSQIKVLEIDYIEVNIVKEILDNKEKIYSDYIYILLDDYGLKKNFYKNFEKIKNLKKNIVLGYENINVKETKDEYVNYVNFQDDYCVSDKLINFIKIEKKIFMEKIVSDIHLKLNNILLNMNFDLISVENYTTKIIINNNIILNNEDIILKNFRNLHLIKEFNSIYESYINFRDKDIVNSYENYVRLLYNQLNDVKLTCFIVYNNHNEIIEYLKTTKYNNIKNYLYIIGNSEIKTDGLKFYVKKYSNDINNIRKIADEIELNYHCVSLKSLDNIDKIIYSDKTNIIDGANEYISKKTSIILLKFFNLKESSFDNYFIELGKNIFKFFNDDLLIIDNKFVQENIQYKENQYNKNLIEELYKNKNYDECIFLINFVIKNKIYKDDTYVSKIFFLIDKINYYLSPRDLSSLFDLLEIKNFDEFFNICMIFKYHSFKNFADCVINNFFSKIDKNLDIDKLLKFIYILFIFDKFKREIDISDDKKYINFILKNISLISKNYKKFSSIKKNVNSEEIYTNLLLFLSSRLELITNKHSKKIINKEINNFLGINLINLQTEDKKKLLEVLKNYPSLIWCSVESLSDFMISSADIMMKRSNLNYLCEIILFNWDYLKESFKQMAKDKINFFQSNFKYSYHGLENKELFTKIVEIQKRFTKIIIELNSGKESFTYTENNVPKKRIGFISDFLTRHHSVFKDRHQVIKYLSEKDDFEVYLITYSDVEFKFIDLYRKTKKVKLNIDLLENIKTIRKLKLDKLVFCEIGMDARIIHLAHFRLANKQYNTWGHSDTSGYPEIDYFVSSKLYELPEEESSEHYSEKLILQNGMCTCYVNPTSEYNLIRERSEYGLSNFEKLIMCPQSLFKIHPDFDFYIFEILLKNPNASIVLLDNSKKIKMYERWDNVITKYPKYMGILSRVKFVPPQNHKNFVNLMKCSDVLIDPYPFGGCNSSLESFSLHKPLVTQPSRRINGRFTYGFYKKMEMEEMIAKNRKEYVDIVTRLLEDKEFYDKQVNLLKERSDILFEDQETLKEWEELMSE